MTNITNILIEPQWNVDYTSVDVLMDTGGNFNRTIVECRLCRYAFNS